MRAYISFDNGKLQESEEDDDKMTLQSWIKICDCGGGKAEIMINLILERYLQWKLWSKKPIFRLN